jgi:NTP pyrophosphatase (non-canonical NTP hydrolase)
LKTLDELAETIRELQARKFPNQTLAGVSFHLLMEAGEASIEVAALVADLADAKTDEEKERLTAERKPRIAEELFDTFALLIGTAKAAGIDLVEAGRLKIPEIEEREWQEADENGVIEHVR